MWKHIKLPDGTDSINSAREVGPTKQQPDRFLEGRSSCLYFSDSSVQFYITAQWMCMWLFMCSIASFRGQEVVAVEGMSDDKSAFVARMPLEGFVPISKGGFAALIWIRCLSIPGHMSAWLTPAFLAGFPASFIACEESFKTIFLDVSAHKAFLQQERLKNCFQITWRALSKLHYSPPSTPQPPLGCLGLINCSVYTKPFQVGWLRWGSSQTSANWECLNKEKSRWCSECKVKSLTAV